MSGYAEDTAHGAPEKSGRPTVLFSLTTALKMLPLVRQIAHEVREQSATLDRLQPEEERLHRQRRNLAWPERARRYELQHELTAAERRLQEATAELESLGLMLLDARTGQVGFPTRVNSRLAYFCWLPGEEGLKQWQFADETVSHPIPSLWLKAADAAQPGRKA